MTEKSGTVKNGNGLKIPKTLAFEKRFDFYEQLWKEGIITKKITRAEYKDILDKLGPSACRVCGKESEKKTDIGFRKTCKKCTEKAAKERKAKKAAAMKKWGKGKCLTIRAGKTDSSQGISSSKILIIYFRANLEGTCNQQRLEISSKPSAMR